MNIALALALALALIMSILSGAGKCQVVNYPCLLTRGSRRSFLEAGTERLQIAQEQDEYIYRWTSNAQM